MLNKMSIVVKSKTFMQKFSFPKTENCQFKFSPQIPYVLVAERSEATSKTLPNSYWLCILKVVRMHFAACGGEEAPPASAAPPHR